jgi:hypothetical protein
MINGLAGKRKLNLIEQEQSMFYFGVNIMKHLG